MFSFIIYLFVLNITCPVKIKVKVHFIVISATYMYTVRPDSVAPEFTEYKEKLRTNIYK